MAQTGNNAGPRGNTRFDTISQGPRKDASWLNGQFVSAFLPPGLENKPALLGLHPTAKTMLALADDLGWCL